MPISTLTVSSTKPTLLFRDDTPERNFRFVLDDTVFSMEGADGAGWDKLMVFDQSDDKWYLQDTFVIQGVGTSPTLSLWYSSTQYWTITLNSGATKFICYDTGANPCIDIKPAGDVILKNNGTTQTQFFTHGAIIIQEDSTSVDVVQFQDSGTTKASIGSGGLGSFTAVTCGGSSSKPSDTGRYLGELRLRYDDGEAEIWAWVKTGPSTEGWRGVALS